MSAAAAARISARVGGVLVLLALSQPAHAQHVFDEDSPASPYKRDKQFFDQPAQPFAVLAPRAWDENANAARFRVDAKKERTVEIAFGERILMPGDYAIAIAKASLAAGPGFGVALEARYVRLAHWVFAVDGVTVQRSSHDARLSQTRLWQLGVGADYRLHLGRFLELRPGARAAYGWLDFDDAHAVTTGLALSAMLTLQVTLLAGFALEASGGVTLQPTGGNGFTDVTIKPASFITLGFCWQVFS